MCFQDERGNSQGLCYLFSFRRSKVFNLSYFLTDHTILYVSPQLNISMLSKTVSQVLGALLPFTTHWLPSRHNICGHTNVDEWVSPSSRPLVASISTYQIAIVQILAPFSVDPYLQCKYLPSFFAPVYYFAFQFHGLQYPCISFRYSALSDYFRSFVFYETWYCSVKAICSNKLISICFVGFPILCLSGNFSVCYLQ